MVNNNRGNARLNSMIPIQVMLEDRSVIEALVSNIGLGGVKLLLSTSVPVGNLVRLAIGHKNTMVTVVAECIWVKQTTFLSYDYCAGFAFQNVSATVYHKILKLLLQLSDNDRMDL
jgi:hypothetical protein